MKIPLRLGPLKVEGYQIRRSGANWLGNSGQVRAANEVVAYFNLALSPCSSTNYKKSPLQHEKDFQVACASPVPGRFTFNKDISVGGMLNFIGVEDWNPETIVGYLETELKVEHEILRLLLLAGRRLTPLGSAFTGLMPGWNIRSRGWWSHNGIEPLSLLAMGACVISELIVGEKSAFLELFSMELASRQFISVPAQPAVPCAPFLTWQLKRTPEIMTAVAEDLRDALLSAGTALPDDWMYAATLLKGIEHRPILDSYDCISAAGYRISPPAEMILLSLSSEPIEMLRHKKYGYSLHLFNDHRKRAGPSLAKWFAKSFEVVTRSIDDIKRDYEELISTIKTATGAHLLILNRSSTSGDEDPSNYAPFEAPLSNWLPSVAAKELNLMLHDLEHGEISIIDQDQMAAELGQAHLPDGTHHSREFQQVIRQEVLAVMNSVEKLKWSNSAQSQVP